MQTEKDVQMKVTKKFHFGSTIMYYNEHNQLHCENGPAISWSDGVEQWWINGKLHRVDGPAVTDPDGYQSWWLNDIQYSHGEWLYLLSIEYKWKEFCEVH